MHDEPAESKMLNELLTIRPQLTTTREPQLIIIHTLLRLTVNSEHKSKNCAMRMMKLVSCTKQNDALVSGMKFSSENVLQQTQSSSSCSARWQGLHYSES